MANKKISQLTEVTNPTSMDVIPVVNASETKKAQLGNLPISDATQSALDGKQDTLGYTAENVANRSTDVDADKTSLTKYPVVKAVYDWAVSLFATISQLNTKQDTLVSGTNIKTINSESLLGSGDIAIDLNDGLLQTPNALDGTLQIVKDQLGTDSALEISTDYINCTGQRKISTNTIIGEVSTESSGNGVIIGKNAKSLNNTDSNNIAIGISSNTGLNAVSIGSFSSANWKGVSLGYSTSSAVASVSLGYDATSNGNNAIAIGNQSGANNQGAVVIGNSMTTSKQYVTIVGGQSNTASTNTHATVVGGYQNSSTGQYSISGGYSNVASNTGAVALGYDNTASGDRSVAIGHSNEATGTGSVSIGYNNTSTAYGGIALGFNSLANSSFSISLGYQNTASAKNSTSNGHSCVSRINGCYSHAYTRFSQNGDSQYTDAISRKEDILTTGATTELFLDGSSELIIPNGTNRVWNVTIKYTAVVTSITGTATGVSVGDCKNEVLTIGFKKIGGTSSVVGSLNTLSTNEDSSMSTASFGVTAGASQEMKLDFTAPTFSGGGSVTTRVVAKVELTEVAF